MKAPFPTEVHEGTDGDGTDADGHRKRLRPDATVDVVMGDGAAAGAAVTLAIEPGVREEDPSRAEGAANTRGEQCAASWTQSCPPPSSLRSSPHTARRLRHARRRRCCGSPRPRRVFVPTTGWTTRQSSWRSKGRTTSRSRCDHSILCGTCPASLRSCRIGAWSVLVRRPELRFLLRCLRANVAHCCCSGTTSL